MRSRILPALFGGLLLWTAPSASADVEIDTSSPDAAMASLAELHETWTLMQFMDLMRAAVVLTMPKEIEDPAFWQQSPSRVEFLPDAFATGVGLSIYMPLRLEGDPFVDNLDAEKLGRWLQEMLRHGLQGRTIEDLVDWGRRRERAGLVQFRKAAESWLRELEEQVESAEAAASHPDASVMDKHAFDTLQRRLADALTRIERFDRRLNELEQTERFVPGATDCDLDQGIDLSTERTMMADLEVLARTCPQQRLIRFLRAAAILSKLPARLAEPGARMASGAVGAAEDDLSSAVQAIAGLVAVLQEEALIRGVESIPARLKKILDGALEGRTVADVSSEGERVERAFLVTLRNYRSAELRSAIEKDQAETSDQEAAASKRPSSRVRRLRADIERIDRRLDLLEGSAPLGR